MPDPRGRWASAFASVASVTEAARLAVFVVGNASRGDDALGPALLASIEALLPAAARVTVDFQLQIEHALALVEADLVLFIDAELRLKQDYSFREIHAGRRRGVFSHALSPAQVLEVFEEICATPAPPAFVLGIAAHQFGLGSTLSGEARRSLAAARAFAGRLLGTPAVGAWRDIAGR